MRARIVACMVRPGTVTQEEKGALIGNVISFYYILAVCDVSVTTANTCSMRSIKNSLKKSAATASETENF